MLNRILSDKQEALLKRERTWLNDLQVVLAKLGAVDDDQETLKRSIHQLDELFLLVIVGEFNAGKSAFINALLGHTMLKEGVTPTTAQINVLRFGPSNREIVSPHLHLISEPVEMLQHLNIVDTPGTNAVIREHQAITEEFVPRSDLVIFITSADRPFTESERQFMEQIKEWGKKVIIAINKVDLFESDEDRGQVINFVRDNATSLLETAPDIFPVSARLAQKGRVDKGGAWHQSGFGPLENYIHGTLDQTSRVQLKLLNPLGVGERLLNKYLKINENRLSLLAADFAMLDNLQAQLDLYRHDMEHNFKVRMGDVEKILFAMETRGNLFFDDTMRLVRVADLMNKSHVQNEFEHKVVGDVPLEIERKVTGIIDWFVNADLKQWQDVTEYLKERREWHKEQIVGEIGAGFHYDRERLIDSVGRAAQIVIDTYDKTAEAKQIAESAQRAVTTSAVTEVGALGLGALLTAIATTVAADVTGLLAAGAVAAVGLFIIPSKRRAAKREMAEKIGELRQQLVDALTNQFQQELDQSIQRINEAISPYTRFVRSERTKLEGTKEELEQAQQTQAQLRAEIDDLV